MVLLHTPSENTTNEHTPRDHTPSCAAQNADKKAELSNEDKERVVSATKGYSVSDASNLFAAAFLQPAKEAMRAALSGPDAVRRAAAIKESSLRPVVLEDFLVRDACYLQCMSGSFFYRCSLSTGTGNACQSCVANAWGSCKVV